MATASGPLMLLPVKRLRLSRQRLSESKKCVWWSSGAIFSKWGLAHASPFAFLLIRFAIALLALVLLIPSMKLQMPRGANTGAGGCLRAGQKAPQFQRTPWA